jgi:signal transduction histidine kinase
MRSFGRAWATALLLLFSAVSSTAGEPRRVLLLHSFGPHFAPWNAVAGRFREELVKHSPAPIDLYEASLEMARLLEPPDQRPFVDYLRALFSGRSPDLVVTIGAPAARFIQQYRPQIFPSTPLLIAAADARAVDSAAMTPNDAAVTTTLDLPKLIENILHVLPDTTNIAFVIGASPLERFWVDELRRAVEPFTKRVTFEWLNEMPFEEMLTRAAARPSHSAIFYASVRVDVRGVPHEEDRVLTKLREVANAPIFGYIDINLGHGIVGGPLLSTEEIGGQIASAAVRILGGEAPNAIKEPPIGLRAPVYDWRELQRWNISKVRLPVGATIAFREPTAWERYRWPLSAIFAALLLQGVLLSWLLFERRSRRVAQLESRRRTLEVMHLNGTAEAGALAASFAHELSQPLVAITMNLETARSVLHTKSPEIGKLNEVLDDIHQANQHATNMIQRLGLLLKPRGEVGLEEFDLNEVIMSALHILGPEANKRNVTLQRNDVEQPLPVLADRVHLLQVMLILPTNAMDAMTGTPLGARRITIETAMSESSQLEVSVIDTGSGIPKDKLGQVFETFYTTKAHGTGLGLSIARTIIETYGGKIWAENRPHGGAAFHFTLPLSRRASSPN